MIKSFADQIFHKSLRFPLNALFFESSFHDFEDSSDVRDLIFTILIDEDMLYNKLFIKNFDLYFNEQKSERSLFLKWGKRSFVPTL